MSITIEQMDKILSLILSHGASNLHQGLVLLETIGNLSEKERTQLSEAIFHQQHTIEVCCVLDKIFTSEALLLSALEKVLGQPLPPVTTDPSIIKRQIESWIYRNVAWRSRRGSEIYAEWVYCRLLKWHPEVAQQITNWTVGWNIPLEVLPVSVLTNLNTLNIQGHFSHIPNEVLAMPSLQKIEASIGYVSVDWLKTIQDPKRLIDLLLGFDSRTVQSMKDINFSDGLDLWAWGVMTDWNLCASETTKLSLSHTHLDFLFALSKFVRLKTIYFDFNSDKYLDLKNEQDCWDGLLCLSSMSIEEVHFTGISSYRRSSLLKILLQQNVKISCDTSVGMSMLNCAKLEVICERALDDEDYCKTIVELDCRKQGLREIPETIFALKYLRKLRLNQNDLTTLPETIGFLSNLKSLDLERNKLTSLPYALAKLTQLHHLYLRGNGHLKVLPNTVRMLSNVAVHHESIRSFTELDAVYATIQSRHQATCNRAQAMNSFVRMEQCIVEARMHHQRGSKQSLVHSRRTVRALGHDASTWWEVKGNASVLLPACTCDGVKLKL